MSDMVKYRAVSFKKDQIAALYFTMSDIVHDQKPCSFFLMFLLCNSKDNFNAKVDSSILYDFKFMSSKNLIKR